MTRYAMAVDKTRCIGCHACAMACKVNNNLPKDVWWNTIRMSEGQPFDCSVGEYGGELSLEYHPVNCQHCANPSCLTVCPTGATQQREDGIVWVDTELCIGCDSCINACPYDVRRHLADDLEFYTEHAIGDVAAPQHAAGKVGKCDFCKGRIDRGEAPACMVLCPGRARYWGDIDDPESEISKAIAGREIELLFEEAGTEPQFFYFK
ncbi:DMSO reductase iron-sulfur subunit [Slackia heliotrinireducens]|uniref:Fe-S-cluster-containing hydrogenase subunit n=1 Tax=Slackia heliotrinireducens (strain ATCC 29202 / DSM 20476 / NCTC 11029 / RHS 1) TaxID=471855 RepID=C7N7C5_SLAHD|nr:4Fe-4S dicluster domain-containing protein [Slackia heliotrinireducens]ACV22810.1 Fe-S-cluster-containing hydrogenase subunit [Slackia heliotrinireducens DSM 20476]VEH01522.1 DMSO reductase iron-sulfur subunit [Slackia heliotrinireducens]